MSPLESDNEESVRIPLNSNTDVVDDKGTSEIITCQPVKAREINKDGDLLNQNTNEDCDCCLSVIFCCEFCKDWCNIFACITACLEGNLCLGCVNGTCEFCVDSLEGCGECCVSCSTL